MLIGAQTIESLRFTLPSSDELSWFAVRQPGVLRLMQNELSADDDALAAALLAAWQIFAAYRQAEGIPCARLSGQSLSRAYQAVTHEAGRATSRGGIAVRQPALCEYVLARVREPPLPLTMDQQETIALLLWAVIYALDEAVSGRPIPSSPAP